MVDSESDVPMMVSVTRTWSGLDDASRIGVGAWVLLACPLFGVGAALDSRLWPMYLNGLASLLGLVFGVPVILVLVTAALARFRAKTTIALTACCLVVAGFWALVLEMMAGSAVT
jgi:hypothetical protein